MSEGVVFLDIDTQHDFMNTQGKLYVPGAEKMIPNLKGLFKLAEKNHIPIISSLDTHRRNDPEFKAFPPHCIRGTKGHRKIKATIIKKEHSAKPRVSTQAYKQVSHKPKQIFIKKYIIDIFSNPQIKIILKPYRIAYVFGVALDFCVKAACLGLAKLGIKTYLIKDATQAVTVKGKTETLRLLKHKGVILLTTEEVIKKLSKTNY